VTDSARAWLAAHQAALDLGAYLERWRRARLLHPSVARSWRQLHAFVAAAAATATFAIPMGVLSIPPRRVGSYWGISRSVAPPMPRAAPKPLSLEDVERGAAAVLRGRNGSGEW